MREYTLTANPFNLSSMLALVQKSIDLMSVKVITSHGVFGLPLSKTEVGYIDTWSCVRILDPFDMTADDT